MRLHKLYTLVAMTVLLAVAGTLYAADGVENPFHSIVDAAFVKQHVTIPMDEAVMIIDSRPKRAQYNKGHIPMAVSIPDSEFDKLIDKLPASKDALLIFYCGGLKCPLSHKSAWKAEKLGYKNVKVFAEGFPGWTKVAGNYSDVSVEWVKSQIDGAADLILVDSRPRRPMYEKGHIPTAISIPTSEFDKHLTELPADKAKTLVFYCGGFKCPLSHKAAEKALALGYTDVKVFSAGYPAWKEAYGDAPAGSAIKAGGEEGSIDIEQFKDLLANKPESILLIDVRDPGEYAAGHFKTAVNMPTDTLEAKIPTLPSDKPIVFVCSTGARSGEGYYMLKDLRPELKTVYYLDAEVDIKKDGAFTIVKH
ncbi:MAG: rhodanese-like domain-containing protein [Pseudomonadota bacterium]